MAVYFVFRRNDGFVGLLTAETALTGRQRLASHKNRGGERVDYEILRETDDWDVAHLLTLALRQKCTNAQCVNVREPGCGELCAPCWNDTYYPHPNS